MKIKKNSKTPKRRKTRSSSVNSVNDDSIKSRKMMLTYKDFLKMDSEEHNDQVPFSSALTFSDEALFVKTKKDELIEAFPELCTKSIEVIVFDSRTSSQKGDAVRMGALKLAANSETFKNVLIEQKFGKSDSTIRLNVTLPSDAHRSEFIQILQNIRLGTIFSLAVNDTNLEGLLHWSKLLRIGLLKSRIYDFCQSTLNWRTSCDYASLAIKFRLPTLLNETKICIAKEFDKLIGDVQLHRLDGDVVNVFFSIDQFPINVANEALVALAALSWAEANYSKDRDYVRASLGKIVQQIRFQAIPPDRCWNELYPRFKAFLSAEDSYELHQYIYNCLASKGKVAKALKASKFEVKQARAGYATKTAASNKAGASGSTNTQPTMAKTVKKVSKKKIIQPMPVQQSASEVREVPWWETGAKAAWLWINQ